MNVSFSQAAEDDVAEITDYYDSQRIGLGDEFLDELRIAISRIVDNPYAWHPMDETFRRFQVRRFPYGIIYQVTDDNIIITTVVHLHREPNHWRERLQRSSE